MKSYSFSFLILCVISFQLHAQSLLPYKNSKLSVDVRVKDLLSRMTTEEKFWQLFMIPGDLGKDASQYKNGIFGFQVSAASAGNSASSQMLSYGTGENALLLAQKINAIQQYFVEKTRLGIPIIAFDECLHGLVRQGATSFPQAIALAATWDTALMRQVSTAIAVETKVRGIRDVLSPVINIANDVRWGRTEETYGEDPFLSSEMAVAFVSPFEKMGVVTTPKHFIANVGDGGRDSYPIHYNERFMEEEFFPPFLAAIKRGGARSIMTAYNSYDGSPATANDWLLNKKLKSEWKFNGFVISDASAVGGATVLHNTATDYPASGQYAINNGLDVIFQTEYKHHELFIPPFLNGKINQKRIDDAVSRVLRAKFELGLFEHPYTSISEAEQWVNNTSHKQIAKKAALESIVLLKNDHQILPLRKTLSSIAVIGKDAMEGRLGGYSGPSNGTVNILDGIRAKLGNQVNVAYAEGVDRNNIEWVSIPAEYLSMVENGKTFKGLKGEYFNSSEPGQTPLFSRVDGHVDFHWTLFPPDPKLTTDNYSVRWTGKLISPESGKFKIGLEGNDGYKLYINNKLVVNKWLKGGYHTSLVDHEFVKGESYDVKIEFRESQGNALIKFVWNFGIRNDHQQKINEAISIAKSSDATIVVVGIKEGEFQDRATLSLPGHQETLIKELASLGKPVVVVLVGGSAITMHNWIDQIDGVLDVWYPGEEGGHAIADILFGDANPSGKLPITFPLSEAQLPLVYNHKPTGRGDDYNNMTGQPLFPFGYGLSYTNFSYSNIQFQKQKIKKGESSKVFIDLKNTGDREGDEVVQLYIKDLFSSVARPVQELKGFQRVHLKAGESKTISFVITPDMLTMLDAQMKTIIEPGTFRIMIGSSSRDLWLKTDLEIF